MFVSEQIRWMKFVVDALVARYPELARYFEENFSNPSEHALLCVLYTGDNEPLDNIAPKTAFSNKTSVVSRYQPGPVEVVHQHAELPNLVDIQTPDLKDEAQVFFNFNLGSSAEYAVNASTANYCAQHADVFVLCKSRLVTKDEIEHLRLALPLFRQLNPSRELPFVYLHLAEDSESPEAADAQFTANLDVLMQQVPGGVGKAFKCNSLNTDDIGYEMFQQYLTDISETVRQLFVSSLWETFISEVRRQREAMLSTYTTLNSECTDYEAFQERVETFYRIRTEQPETEARRAWQDVIYNTRHKVNKEFRGNGNGNGKVTVYDVALEDVERPRDEAEFDEFRLQKNIEISESFAGLVKQTEANLESQFTGLRIDIRDKVMSELEQAGFINLPKSIAHEIGCRFDTEIEMNEFDATNRSGRADRLFRYTLCASFGASLGVQAASGIVILISAIKGGAKGGASGAPLGPVGLIAGIIVGSGVGIVVANQMIKHQDSKAWRVEARNQVMRLMSNLNQEGLYAVEQWGNGYGRLLEDDYTALYQAIDKAIKLESKIYKATPEEREAKREALGEAIEKLDSVLESCEESEDDNDNVRD